MANLTYEICAIHESCSGEEHDCRTARGTIPDLHQDAQTRSLTADERARLAAGVGVLDIDVTCEGDTGHGPCGTYTDWRDGQCVKGHRIEVDLDGDE